MSWAGILRPGDEFCRVVRSRRAVLDTDRGPNLRRFYGTWSTRYHRFTTNLSSAQVVVRPVEPGQRAGDGIQCILHWVALEDIVRTGGGSVCQADGWPVDLWRAFTSQLHRLRGGSVGEKLLAYLHSDSDGDVPIVAEWRRLLSVQSPVWGSGSTVIGRGWIPVPAKLELPSQTSACIFSWSPSSFRFDSLKDALESEYARRASVDITNQAKYYLECILAKLHQVAFGANDALEDKAFERIPAFLELVNSFTDREVRRIASSALGPLDRFG